MTQESVAPESSDASASAAPLPQESAPQIPQKLRVKIDGAEEEVDVESLKADYQKFKSADKRFQEAAALRKEFGPIADVIKKKDLKALAKMMGEDDFRQGAEQFLLDWLQFQEMPEAEKKALKLEQELAAEREARKAEHEERNKAAYEEATQSAYQEIDVEITEAIKATGKRPTPRMIARIAETMLASLVDETKPRFTGKQAVEHTLKEFQQDFGEYLGQIPADELRKMLPRETLDALRQAQVDEVLAQSPIKTKKRETDDETKSKKPRNMSTDDWFKHMERRLG